MLVLVLVPVPVPGRDAYGGLLARRGPIGWTAAAYVRGGDNDNPALPELERAGLAEGRQHPPVPQRLHRPLHLRRSRRRHHPETRSCDSSEQRSWWVHKRGDQVSFENQPTCLCLDDGGAGPRMPACSCNRDQTWR